MSSGETGAGCLGVGVFRWEFRPLLGSRTRVEKPRRGTGEVDGRRTVGGRPPDAKLGGVGVARPTVQTVLSPVVVETPGTPVSIPLDRTPLHPATTVKTSLIPVLDSAPPGSSFPLTPSLCPGISGFSTLVFLEVKRPYPLVLYAIRTGFLLAQTRTHPDTRMCGVYVWDLLYGARRRVGN